MSLQIEQHTTTRAIPGTLGLIAWQEETVDGMRFCGWRSLPTGKPVLQFIHGTGLCCLAYKPLLMALQGSFDLVLFDIQGHGDSEQGEIFLGWQRNAEHTHQIWQRMKHHYISAPSFGIGHSLGGTLTMMRASRHPQDFDALYLLDPFLLSKRILLLSRLQRLMGQQRKLAHVELTKRRRNGWNDEFEALSYLRSRGMFKSWSESALQAYIAHAMKPSAGVHKLKCAPVFEASILASTPEKLWPSIRKLNIPTRILVGEQSYTYVQSAIREAEKKNPNIRVETTSGSHFFVQERPQQIAEKIKRDLTRQQLSQPRPSQES